ncbi:unnamed protein product, partial [Oikopleura dioica]
MQGDGDLLSSLLSNSDSRSNTSKSSRRKKLPLPSNGENASSLLGDFLEPSSSTSNKSGKRLAPLFSFGRENNLLSSGSHTVEGESGAQDLLERLTNLSSRSNESGSKRSVNTNRSRRNLPKPSQVSKGDDLLSMFSSQPQENDYDSENIVYEPVDDDEVEQDEDYFDEGNPPMSPRDTLAQASDVLSILS